MNISGASISTTFNFLLFSSRSRHALPLSSKATKFLMLFPESHPPSSSSIPSSTNRVVAHQHGCRLTSDVRQDAISKSPLFRPGIRLFLLLEEQVTSWRKKSQDTPNWKSLRRAPNLFLSFSFLFGCKFVLGQRWRPFLFYFFYEGDRETKRRRVVSGPTLSGFGVLTLFFNVPWFTSVFLSFVSHWLSRKRNSAISRAECRETLRQVTYHPWIGNLRTHRDNQFLSSEKKSAGN